MERTHAEDWRYSNSEKQNNMAAYTATWCHVTSGPMWLPSTMSEFVILLEPGSVLTSMALLAPRTIQMPEVWTTTWGQADVQGPCCCQGQTNPGGLHWHLRPWSMLELQPRAMCGSIAQLQQGSMMIPLLYYCQRPQDSWSWWPGHRSGPAPRWST